MQFSTFLAPFLGLLIATSEALPTELSKRTARSSTPSGCLTVRKTGTKSGEYSTVSAALSKLGTSATAKACIFIYAGTYPEQITVNYKGALTIYGQTTNTGDYKSNTVTLTHTISSSDAGTLDLSSTANIVSSNFNAYNLNFLNGWTSSQAVAVTANGNKQGFYGCSFKSYQDTLYAKDGDQYYSNCYIEGAVDFIFGKASAWFAECTVASNGAGYVTASSREDSSDPAWYVFDHSTIQAAAGHTDLAGKVYLGRPWRVLARVMYQYCSLSNIVNAAGYTTMAAGATPTYMEFQNTGAGSSTSARKYFTKATGAVSKAWLWPTSGSGWIDTSY